MRPFSAVLLAAGLGTRMGRDKAILLAPDGRPLWERQRDLLVASGAAEIIFSVRPAQTWVPRDPSLLLVHDREPGLGPLAGLVAALERAMCAHLAVLAIDLPRIESAWFTALLADCASGIGVVGCRADAGSGKNFFEPLAAIYPREILPLARAALAEKKLSVHQLLATAVAQGLLRVRKISAAETPQFENWNEPPAPRG